jgi:hypothetical protein
MLKALHYKTHNAKKLLKKNFLALSKTALNKKGSAFAEPLK